MRLSGKDIYMIRGDSETILVSCTDSDGSPVPFAVGDTVRFTVKRQASDTTKVLQKVVTEFDEGVATISLAPADTKNASFGKYVYDVQLTSAEGRVTTIIPPSRFVLEEEVTHE